MSDSFFNSQNQQDHFLRHHWQKKPLLMRGAFSVDQLSFAAEELAGLSGESEANSRLIVGSGPEQSLREGPFEEKDFASLPEANWTLLVQEVDHFVDEVLELRRQFSFLPSWRIEDIMISYAANKGGVGAHVDQYDVFLVQAQGKRRWRYGSQPLVNPDIQDDSPMALLKNFEPEFDELLSPGDVLYLPPGVAHDGCAEGTCMTWSVGFRAPSFLEMAHQLLQNTQQEESLRWQDSDRQFQQNLGSEIKASDLQRTRELFLKAADLLTEDLGLLGRMVTSHRDGEWVLSVDEESKVEDWVVHGRGRWAWQKHESGALFFANGKEFYLQNDSLARNLDAALSAGKLKSSHKNKIIQDPAGTDLWLWMLECGLLMESTDD